MRMRMQGAVKRRGDEACTPSSGDREGAPATAHVKVARRQCAEEAPQAAPGDVEHAQCTERARAPSASSDCSDDTLDRLHAIFEA